MSFNESTSVCIHSPFHLNSHVFFLREFYLRGDQKFIEKCFIRIKRFIKKQKLFINLNEIKDDLLIEENISKVMYSYLCL